MNTKQRATFIADLVQLAKINFGVFDEVKKAEAFHAIKKAKICGYLKKQHNDPCLSDYVNLANSLLSSHGTENFTTILNQNPNAPYVCLALVATNSILITA